MIFLLTAKHHHTFIRFACKDLVGALIACGTALREDINIFSPAGSDFCTDFVPIVSGNDFESFTDLRGTCHIQHQTGQLTCHAVGCEDIEGMVNMSFCMKHFRIIFQCIHDPAFIFHDQAAAFSDDGSTHSVCDFPICTCIPCTDGSGSDFFHEIIKILFAVHEIRMFFPDLFHVNATVSGTFAAEFFTHDPFFFRDDSSILRSGMSMRDRTEDLNIFETGHGGEFFPDRLHQFLPERDSIQRDHNDFCLISFQSQSSGIELIQDL